VSTRAAIAKPNGDGWIGRYHHFDGYPSGLGATLWSAYHEHFRGDIKAMRAYLIDSPEASAGWSSINDRDLSQPAMWEGKGNGPLSYFVRGEAPSDPHQCSCPSPESKCDPLFIEWAYVLADHSLIIFSAIQGKGPEGYEHRLVGQIPWDAPEPNWEKFEREG